MKREEGQGNYRLANWTLTHFCQAEADMGKKEATG